MEQRAIRFSRLLKKGLSREEAREIAHREYSAVWLRSPVLARREDRIVIGGHQRLTAAGALVSARSISL